MIGIVFLQNPEDGQALRGKRPVGGAVRIAACGIRGTVRAVASHTEYAHTGKSVQRGGSRQGQLLIPAPFSLAGELHNGLAACQEGQLPALAAMGTGNGSQEAACLLGLAAELIRQQHRGIAQLLTFRRGGGTQLPDGAGDLGGHIVKMFGRFPLQAGLGLRSQAEAVFFRDGRRLGTGGGVRHRGAGGNHIQRIPQNIRQHNGKHPGRFAAFREAAALHRGQALADGVDLHNIRSTGQKLAGDVLQHLGIHQGLFKQRAAAAGEQEQHRILPGEARNQLQRRLGAGEGVVIRHRMTGLPAVKISQRAHNVAVFGHHHAAFDPVPQAVPGCLRHLPGGFARGHQQHPSGEIHPLQSSCHRVIRLNRPDGGGHNPIGLVAHCHIHNKIPHS